MSLVCIMNLTKNEFFNNVYSHMEDYLRRRGIDMNYPHPLTAKEMEQYVRLLEDDFNIAYWDKPIAVLVKNGVKVCLINKIVAYVDEEQHIFENLDDLIKFVDNHAN